ncbi:DUF421 domain-containing protein [Limimaricola hongkongensis]|uniref:DUF421 domain-containing protein n=1 Tax=Limimaricola hongkongensis DSM 17492 TaxID=1122180 RepID=A0A017H9J9_9RHOB|nr:YetF domain-containing protein [Limimaricola hongkongensis]EYD70985.1 hypothetical protein Lokhon_02629 [Limimaricola hongkongensis DSM 17492]
MIEEMLFQGWSGIIRTVLVGALAYVGLIAFLRISGKRTLAKLNAFDLVVTVSLGSTLATILLSESVALAEGLTAFAMLIGLQYAVARGSVASGRFARLVRSEPRLLMHKGEILHDALRRERVTEEELLSIIRSNGSAAADEVAAVVIESDGAFSVIPKPAGGGAAEFASADLPRRG